jgi:hypothetical protein
MDQETKIVLISSAISILSDLVVEACRYCKHSKCRIKIEYDEKINKSDADLSDTRINLKIDPETGT